MTPYCVLTSRWRLDSDIAPVWALLIDVEGWPRWWRHVQRARRVVTAPTSPTGDVVQLDWSGAFPYRGRLNMVTAVAERPRLLESHVGGVLRGVAAWMLEPAREGGVEVTYRREIELHRAWMRLGAAVIGPVFEWNHFFVVRAGARGMADALGCRLWQAGEWSVRRRV